MGPLTQHQFACPYCAQELTIELDMTAGRRQAFSYDCAVCCQPIAIRLQLDAEGLAGFEAEREA